MWVSTMNKELREETERFSSDPSTATEDQAKWEDENPKLNQGEQTETVLVTEVDRLEQKYYQELGQNLPNTGQKPLVNGSRAIVKQYADFLKEVAKLDGDGTRLSSKELKYALAISQAGNPFALAERNRRLAHQYFQNSLRPLLLQVSSEQTADLRYVESRVKDIAAKGIVTFLNVDPEQKIKVLPWQSFNPLTVSEVGYSQTPDFTLGGCVGNSYINNLSR